MANDLTELVFILDRSGSMATRVEDTVGGFNTMLEKQKKQEGACLVSTVLFNDDSTVLHDRLPLAQTPAMTANDYEPFGCTALLDAVGDAIRHVETIHRYARREDAPKRTLFVITTDGMENASNRYTDLEIKKLIEEKKEKDGWEFLFLGANIDAVATARRYGISRDYAACYECDEEGIEEEYDAICDAIFEIRAGKGLGTAWKSKLTKAPKKQDPKKP